MVVLRKDALKDEIVSILSNNAFKDKLYSFKEIKKKLACNVSVGDLQEMLDDLEKEGRIVINNRGQYRVLSSELGYVQGRIFIDELGNGYVEEVADIQGEQVKITYKVYTEDLNDSLNGDLVLLKTTGGSSKGHVLAKVEKVIQRHSNLVFGTVIEENGELALAPEPHNFKHKILLKKKDKTVLNPGQRVLVDIGELVDDRYYLASICRVDVRKEDVNLVDEVNFAIGFAEFVFGIH
jgi:exoribonuclease R